MKRRFSFFLIIILTCFCGYFSFSQSPGFGRHRGAVTSLLIDNDGYFYSAGEDGFVGIWNNQEAIYRFQVSPFGLSSMVLRPGKTQIAVIEDDGLSMHRISSWDHETGENIFTLSFMDSVSFINFSAAGTFLIVGLSGQTGVIFIDSETGETAEPLEELRDSVNFAATSMSEKIMICYSPSGILSYWDLETGIELRHFEVPPNIRGPVLLGNNCYIGGFDPNGLIILDIVTGAALARNNTINGSFFIDEREKADPQGKARFYCLSSTGTANTIFRMEINQSGALTTLNRTVLPPGITEVRTAAYAGGEAFILGNAHGNLWFLNRSLARLLDCNSPEQVIDLAASSEALGFISENGAAGFLPLDYSKLKNGETLRMERVSPPAASGVYTRINADPSAPPGTGSPVFLFWQNSRSIPMLRTLQGSPLNAAGSRIFLEKLPLRYPIRSAAMLGSGILFLNSQGTLSLMNRENGELRFSYAASGAQDAAFINSNTIILGRSAVIGNTPFLMVNSVTGETVPLPYPAMVGLKVYLGSSGAIYGAVVNQAGSGPLGYGSLAGEIQTSVIRLNISNPSLSEKLAEYHGEDSSFFLVESGGNPAFNLGGGAAALYRNNTRTGNRNQGWEKTALERSRGLPQKAVSSGSRIVILDGEGSLCWHDSRTGKLLATFNLYPSHWTLETDGKILRGTVVPMNY